MNDAEPPAPSPATATAHSQRLYWTFQLTGWGLFTLARFVGGVTILTLPWPRLALELLLLNGVALAFTHGLRDFVRRRAWRALPIRKLIGRILAAAFVLGVPLGILTQWTHLTIEHSGPVLEMFAPALSPRWALSVSIVVETINWACVLSIWLVIYFTTVGVREYRSAQLKQSEQTRALQLAELRLLKSQLNPHFLFNALNTVRSLIADHPTRAQTAVTRLANTLRHTLSARQREMVTLAEEWGIVADYLEIESMRFEDRLRIETRIADDAAAVQIPVMLLQTLIENAIKHGIAELPAGGLVRICAVLSDDMLLLEVENPRPAAPVRTAGEGVGLRNARDRLSLLYGGRASLALDLSKPALATARLRIPRSP